MQTKDESDVWGQDEERALQAATQRLEVLKRWAKIHGAEQYEGYWLDIWGMRYLIRALRAGLRDQRRGRPKRANLPPLN